jgi:serine/threonine protein kinase
MTKQSDAGRSSSSVVKSDTPDFERRFRQRMLEDDLAAERSPGRIRPHSLVFAGEEIGRGGLGIVYVFEDAKLKRQVAVKVVKKQVLGNGEKLDRFKREYRLTARLQHPGIPAIYGSGVLKDGRHYYVMRLLKGRSLSDVIRVHHKTKLDDENAFHASLEEMVASLITCCDAIAYAHDHGILHRDIKPANIVVEADGTTFVIDWGMAVSRRQTLCNSLDNESVDRSSDPDEEDVGLETRGDRFIGTPAFMSPEQAAGDSQLHSTRTDVYGLGATLFHILTGEVPHESTGSDPTNVGWRAAVLNHPQPELQRFPSNLPSELVSICRKAMAASPLERYDSARDMASDLRHWQRHEIVEAHREVYSMTDRLWIFFQGHRRLAIAGSVTVLVMLLILSISLFLISKARKSQIAQFQREQEANQLLLSDLEEWSDLIMQDDMLASEAFQPQRMQLLSKLKEQYDVWVDFNSGQSEQSMARAVQGFLRLSLIHEQSGDLELGLKSCQQAIDLSDRMPIDAVPDGTREQLERMYASTLHKLGRSVEAEARLRLMLVKLDSHKHGNGSGRNHAELLHTAGKIHCGIADRQADWEGRTRYYLDALEDFEREILLWESLTLTDATLEDRLGLAAAISAKAFCLHKAVSGRKAVESYQQALSLLEEMQGKFKEPSSQRQIDEYRATIFANMGMSHVNLGDFRSAEGVYKSAIATYHHLHTSLPLIVKYRAELARAWGNLADLYSEMHAIDPAVSNVRELYARQQVIQISAALRIERPEVKVHLEREVLHTVRLCYCLYRMRRQREASELFARLLEKHTSPEDVEHLSPRQRVLCCLGYQLLLQQSKNVDDDLDLQRVNRSLYWERSQSLLTSVDPQVISAKAFIRRLVLHGSAFLSLRGSGDTATQQWLLDVERFTNLRAQAESAVGRP